MNSRSGDRVPAGVSGQAGRGTVGTDAPTAPIETSDPAVALFSPMLWIVAAAYAVLTGALVWLALMLAPWGLLILVLALGALLTSVICIVMAIAIARLEADLA